MLEDEKIEKGKENAESSNPNPVQKLGNSVQENQLSDKTPSEVLIFFIFSEIL